MGTPYDRSDKNACVHHGVALLEIYEDRVVNGLLKAGTVDEPDKAIQLLSREIEIVTDPRRATEDDLWPAIWALAAVLERQFSGDIYIRAGLMHPLRQPAQLTSRCHFGAAARSQDVITIYLGCPPSSQHLALCGDARRGIVSYGSVLGSSEPATPLDCFALAGYLGFAALAVAAGIPAHRQEFAVPRISLPFEGPELPSLRQPGLEFIGLGHLGQAYIALLFFLAAATRQAPRIQLVDKDFFESPNWSTQILIEPNKEWIGIAKAEYLKHRAQTWGWDVESDVTEITWGWHRPEGHSEFAVMGLDRFDVRRMAIAGGYSWVFDAGLGDSFLWPRISWHSIPADNSLAKLLFPDADAAAISGQPTTPFLDRLRNTRGGCGLLIYEEIQASAPCLGLVAAAFLWSEISRFLLGSREQIQASATIWSPIIPPLRTVLAHEKVDAR
jgi:hypothetical protein